MREKNIFYKYKSINNLSFKMLADKTYLDKRTLERIVGEQTIPDLSTIAILVYALDIPKDVIVNYLKNPPKKKKKKKRKNGVKHV